MNTFRLIGYILSTVCRTYAARLCNPRLRPHCNPDRAPLCAPQNLAATCPLLWDPANPRKDMYGYYNEIICYEPIPSPN